MQIGTIIEHFTSGYRGVVLAMANGLVHMLVQDLGVIEDHADNFYVPDMAG